MKQTDAAYVAAIDLGSSCLRGCIGYKTGDVLHVVATASRPVGEEIRRGMVCNVRNLSVLLTDLIRELEENPVCPCRVSEVTVSVNAGSMRTVAVSATDALQGTEEVTENTLEDLEATCESKTPESKALFFSYLQEYLVNGYSSRSPIGEKPRQLEARYKLVVGREEILNNLKELFEGSKTDFRMCPGALACAQGFIPAEQRNRGTVVVDFGAETTTVCVIKNDIVRHLTVLPVGGQSITTDLMPIFQLFQEAENEKTARGSALHFTAWRNGLGPAWYEEGQELDARDKDVNETIVARIEEIVENVDHQIKASNISYPGMTLWLFGGASRLSGLEELLSKRTELKVIRPSLTSGNVMTDGQLVLDDAFLQCVGLLSVGVPGGCEALDAEEEPVAAAEAEPTPVEEAPTEREDDEDDPSAKGFLHFLGFGRKSHHGHTETSEPTPEPEPVQPRPAEPAASQTTRPAPKKKQKKEGENWAASLFDSLEEKYKDA